jgi:hypothetical protein
MANASSLLAAAYNLYITPSAKFQHLSSVINTLSTIRRLIDSKAFHIYYNLELEPSTSGNRLSMAWQVPLKLYPNFCIQDDGRRATLRQSKRRAVVRFDF